MFLGLCIKSMSSTYTKTYKKINYKNCLHLISAKKKQQTFFKKNDSSFFSHQKRNASKQ